VDPYAATMPSAPPNEELPLDMRATSPSIVMPPEVSSGRRTMGRMIALAFLALLVLAAVWFVAQRLGGSSDTTSASAPKG
jgi:hypothetical protein